MFGWLKKTPPARDREIFRYWDGSAEVGIDPLKALRELSADAEFDPQTHMDLAAAGDVEAMQKAIRATRRVFGVRAWGEAGPATFGLTEKETLQLLLDFGDYLSKKNGSTSPTPI